MEDFRRLVVVGQDRDAACALHGIDRGYVRRGARGGRGQAHAPPISNREPSVLHLIKLKSRPPTRARVQRRTQCAHSRADRPAGARLPIGRNATPNR